MSKPGRNDLCVCGSGKKYKKCCLNGMPLQYMNAEEYGNLLEEIMDNNPLIGAEAAASRIRNSQR